MNKLILFGRCLLNLLLILLGNSLQSFETTSATVNSPFASSYTSEVLNKWMEMQIQLMSTTIANFNGPFVRVYAYTGLAAYESILPASSTLHSETMEKLLPRSEYPLVMQRQVPFNLMEKL